MKPGELVELVHGAKLTSDRAIWLLNVEKIVGIDRTPASLDFMLESGAAVAFYDDGPKRGQIVYEDWSGKT